jgi:hypothetical protein
LVGVSRTASPSVDVMDSVSFLAGLRLSGAIG